MTCIAMSVRAELTKVALRPYLRGNPGLLPQKISPRPDDISVVKGVEGCNGQVNERGMSNRVNFAYCDISKPY